VLVLLASATITASCSRLIRSASAMGWPLASRNSSSATSAYARGAGGRSAEVAGQGEGNVAVAVQEFAGHGL
jgi:hypothetical protein